MKHRQLLLIVVLAICAALAACAWFARSVALGQTGVELKYAAKDCTPSARVLVVAVHGLGGDVTRLGSVVKMARKTIPGADLLVPQYQVGWLSNSDPSDLSAALKNAVHEHYGGCVAKRGKDYDQVVLVGYSAGGLLIRRAFLWAFEPSTVPPSDEGSPVQQGWSQRVTRIVLLAGMNRGWSLDDYEDHPLARINYFERKLAGLARHVAEMLNVSGFLLSVERGSPFVADLRLDWVRTAAGTSRLPMVAQLLGTRDEVVTRQDESDLDSVSRGFVFISAGNAGHESILDVDREGRAQDAFREALTRSDDELTSEYPGTKQQADMRGADRIVFIRHGIRDDNTWTQDVQHALCARAGEIGFTCAKKEHQGLKLMKVDSDSYGYFAMLPFLSESTRRDKVRMFVDRYVEQVALSGNPSVEVDFVGHSNGTFLLAKALKDYKAVRVRRVVFANSVVSTGFDWKTLGEGLSPQVQGPLRNYQGSKDFIVATFPGLYEMMWPSSTLGSAGYKKFQNMLPSQSGRVDVRLDGDHGIGVHKDNWPDIVDFLLLDGKITNKKIATENTWVEFLWKFPYLGWLIAALCLVGLFLAITWSLRGPAMRLGPVLGGLVRYGAGGLVVLMILFNA